MLPVARHAADLPQTSQQHPPGRLRDHICAHADPRHRGAQGRTHLVVRADAFRPSRPRRRPVRTGRVRRAAARQGCRIRRFSVGRSVCRPVRFGRRRIVGPAQILPPFDILSVIQRAFVVLGRAIDGNVVTARGRVTQSCRIGIEQGVVQHRKAICIGDQSRCAPDKQRMVRVEMHQHRTQRTTTTQIERRLARGVEHRRQGIVGAHSGPLHHAPFGIRMAQRILAQPGIAFYRDECSTQDLVFADDRDEGVVQLQRIARPFE